MSTKRQREYTFTAPATRSAARRRPTAVGGVLLMLALAPSAPAQPPPADYSGSCTDAGCHGELTQRKFVHGPTSVGSCEACHVEVSSKDHRYRLTSTGASLCAFCHLERHPGELRHKPEADGQCTACHDPHGSESKYFLRAASVPDLCNQCHVGVLDDMKFLHGPVAAGSCLACHDAHASDNKDLLFAPPGEFCIKCHVDVKTQLAGRAYVHAPVRDNCIGCHDAHGSNDRMLLFATGSEACLKCHEEMAQRLSTAKVKHDAMTMEAGCAGCHDPHASDFEHTLRDKPVNLCMSCHDKAIETPDGTITDMKKLFAENTSVHGPIAQGQCSGCHETHGGDHFRLLTKEYPAKFYSKYDEKNYALCFECHEPDLVRTEHTDRLTNFRNGDVNLHFLHVNREKGRTCRACHQAHASSYPKHISKAVPFGNWEIPIVFSQTETGGTCQTGCHKPYGYDRRTPVANGSVTPSPSG